MQATHLAAKVGLPREDIESSALCSSTGRSPPSLTRRQHQVQHLQANLQSRAAMGDSVLETVAAMGAVVDRLYKATSRLGY